MSTHHKILAGIPVTLVFEREMRDEKALFIRARWEIRGRLQGAGWSLDYEAIKNYQAFGFSSSFQLLRWQVTTICMSIERFITNYENRQ